MRGKAKPRVISWIIWTVLLGLMAIVSWQEGQLASAVTTTASTVCCGVVSLLALRHTTLRITRLEKSTLLGAILGFVLWLLLNDPLLVLLTAIVVDTVAYLPTFLNGWHNPSHEPISMFLISVCGSVLVLLTAVLGGANLHGLIYPVYSVIAGGTMVGILISGRIRANLTQVD
jgi:hypothetical protein